MFPFPPATASDTTPEAPAIAIARLGIVNGSDQVSEWVDVHFNPASLQLQISNELKDTENNERKQYIAKSNAKLTMELQFDTSDTGQDVTTTTRKIQAFIAPTLPPEETRPTVPPPLVMFEWGRVKFKGIAESYRETIDFFSAGGIPLRALINLTLSRQDQVFDESPGGDPADVGLNDTASAVDAPASSASDVTNRAASPRAARGVGALNGQESLRFGTGAALTIGASVSLKPPVAFSAGIGAGIGIDLGLQGGVSAGIGLNAALGVATGGTGGVSFGVSAGASAGAPAGVSALARLSAADGAFGALRPVNAGGASLARLDVARLVPQVRSATLSTDRNATFRVGGKATVEGGAGMSADVGARAGVGARLTFDEF